MVFLSVCRLGCLGLIPRSVTFGASAVLGLLHVLLCCSLNFPCSATFGASVVLGLLRVLMCCSSDFFNVSSSGPPSCFGFRVCSLDCLGVSPCRYYLYIYSFL